jgi:DNA-binding CsgD family transcriptional regulator
LGVQESYSTHQDLARFKSELTGEIGKLSAGIAQLAAQVSDAAQSTRTELSDIAKSTGRVSPDALLAQVSELKSLLDGLVQSSKDRTVREEELSAEIAGLKHSLEVIIQQTESTIVQPSSAIIEPRRIRIPTVNPSVAGRLTEREKQVVALVAQGLTNRQMARQLQLSEHVVKAVISVLMTKLRVSTRSEIVAKAVSSPPSLWP